MDTRAHRFTWDAGVRWIGIDLPNVVELRRKVVSGLSDHEYTLLAGLATDPEVITALPNDHPTIIVLEGLSSYLDPTEGEALVSNLCKYFKTGEIVMDAAS